MFICFSHFRPFILADDLRVAYTFQSDHLGLLHSVIQKELYKVTAWSSLRFFQFNLNKYGWICFGAPSINIELELQSTDLPTLQNVVDLGLRYSSDLTFSEQFSTQTRKSRMLLICILRNFHNQEVELILYKTCVRPVLEYCPLVLSNTCICDKLKIESVQRYFTCKLLGYDCGEDYTSRCISLNLDPLWMRRLSINLIFFFKVLHKISFSDSKEIQFSPEGSYNLRNQTGTVTKTTCKTTPRANYFMVMCSKIWNSLLLEIRTCDSIISFKRLLYKLLHPNTHRGEVKLSAPKNDMTLMTLNASIMLKTLLLSMN